MSDIVRRRSHITVLSSTHPFHEGENLTTYARRVLDAYGERGAITDVFARQAMVDITARGEVEMSTTPGETIVEIEYETVLAPREPAA